jgi:hypothetical protein
LTPQHNSVVSTGRGNCLTIGTETNAVDSSTVSLESFKQIAISIPELDSVVSTISTGRGNCLPVGAKTQSRNPITMPHQALRLCTPDSYSSVIIGRGKQCAVGTETHAQAPIAMPHRISIQTVIECKELNSAVPTSRGKSFTIRTETDSYNSGTVILTSSTTSINFERGAIEFPRYVSFIKTCRSKSLSIRAEADS